MYFICQIDHPFKDPFEDLLCEVQCRLASDLPTMQNRRVAYKTSGLEDETKVIEWEILPIFHNVCHFALINVYQRVYK